LGATIADTLAERHGASLQLAAAPDGGTIAKVRFRAGASVSRPALKTRT
jgi:hypothetical protein